MEMTATLAAALWLMAMSGNVLDAIPNGVPVASLAEFANARGGVLQDDTNGYVTLTTRYRQVQFVPSVRRILLDGIACDFPELKLIGIHVGIPWTDEMIAMAWKHENVYIGSDAHSPKYWPEAFVKYIDSYGQDKVMFGTDFPVLGFKRTMDEVLALKLRPDPLRKFLRDNALRVYKLEG